MVPFTLIRAAACDPDKARGILAAVQLTKMQISEADNLDDILQRGQCFIVMDESGGDIGAYVLKANDAEVWISAAAGRACVDLTAAMFALIESQASDFDSIAFQTKRRGLVKKAMERHGYEIAGRAGNCGYIMRKKLS